jgi:hypothetical protein
MSTRGSSKQFSQYGSSLAPHKIPFRQMMPISSRPDPLACLPGGVRSIAAALAPALDNQYDTGSSSIHSICKDSINIYYGSITIICSPYLYSNLDAFESSFLCTLLHTTSEVFIRVLQGVCSGSSIPLNTLCKSLSILLGGQIQTGPFHWLFTLVPAPRPASSVRPSPSPQLTGKPQVLKRSPRPVPQTRHIPTR